MDMNTASNALTQARVEFDRLIGELQAMRDDVMVMQDRSAHWGDVGSANHVNALLARALNFGTGRGE